MRNVFLKLEGQTGNVGRSQERMLTATDLKTKCEVTVLEVENNGNGVLHRRVMRDSFVWGWFQGEACDANTKLERRR